MEEEGKEYLKETQEEEEKGREQIQLLEKYQPKEQRRKRRSPPRRRHRFVRGDEHGQEDGQEDSWRAHRSVGEGVPGLPHDQPGSDVVDPGGRSTTSRRPLLPNSSGSPHERTHGKGVPQLGLLPGPPFAREDIAEGADLITQRLKSLSSTNSGIHYQVSQKLELLPQEKANPASLEETQEAAKSARQEEMVYAKASKAPRQWGANQGGEPPRGGKGKEGKGKKGKAAMARAETKARELTRTGKNEARTRQE